MHVHLRNISYRPANNGTYETLILSRTERIEPSKEERIQSVLPKPDCPLTRIMLTLLNSTIETANS